MLKLLYDFLIAPIELIVEVIYTIFSRMIGNPGIAIIAVSIVVQTIVIPLYKRADDIQLQERLRQQSMSHWVDHINKSFKGEERYMMLTAYYREQGYKSWYAIRSSISVLLQIPFFTAAYHFLSNLNELSGKSFLFINDLSKPDMSLTLSGFAFNVLPIVMTALNVISGVVYTRGMQTKEKVQVHGLALVFLLLLYNSPSGLVLYWTMNNVYSLIKNIVIGAIRGRNETKNSETSEVSEVGIKSVGKRDRLFAGEMLFLALFIGAYIPMNVISSSAAEFVNISHGPLYLTLVNFVLFSGLFILWGNVFYAIASKKAKRIMTGIGFAMCGCVVFDYMFLQRDFGVLTPLFEYDIHLYYPGKIKLLSMIIVLVLTGTMFWAATKHGVLVKRVVSIVVLSICLIIAVDVFSTIKQLNVYYNNQTSEEAANAGKILKLSKNGRNVVVIMLDRAISGFIPYIMNENSEIAESYKGFTYYPNTLSLAGHTNLGAPALFGGYEYTPMEMNKRESELLKDKHNEALLLMPRIFSDNGYDVVVTNPPYSGNYEYSGPGDLSMYKEYKNVEAYHTNNAYTYLYAEKLAPTYQSRQESVLKYYCLMRSSPLVCQEYMYNNGKYFSKVEIAINMEFLKSYATLLNLKNITSIEDEGDNFLLLQNHATHDVWVMNPPDYETPGGSADMDYRAYYNGSDFTIDGNRLMINDRKQASHYQSNAAALKQLGKWFDYLRESGCWDNTRIVIVADHGYDLKTFDYMYLDDGLDVEEFNPLLMVKDFDSSTYQVSEEFMTNADVPSIAMDGIIEGAINPFTGNPVTMDEKKQKQYVTTSAHFLTDNTKYTFDLSDGEWYAVEPGDIFDTENWERQSD